MAGDMRFDVVVIGGGIAGMVTANRVAQLGRRVAVLEQGKEEKYLCNTRYTGGTFHVCLADVMGDAASHREAIERSTAGFARPDLAEAVAQGAPRAVRWLQGEGIRFVKASALSYHGWVVAPVGRNRPGLDWEGRSGDVLLQTLERKLGERGGCVFRGTRARQLRMEDGRCVGVEADTPDGAARFAAEAVVIADGGFQGNLEMVGQNIAPNPSKVRQRGAGTGKGDGLRMALEVGAAATGLDRFYGHLLSIDAFHNDMLWPFPYLDSTVVAGILVDRTGRRLADEGNGGVYLTNLLAGMADPLSTLVIFDQEIWDGPSCQGMISANPYLKNEGATIHVADTIEGLAEKAGLPPETFRETVDSYNAAFDAGTLDKLTPSRRSDRYKPFPLRHPPFYAAPVCPGITYTMGGIVIDGSARVLDDAGAAIPGLYAVGAATGGLEGGPAAAYVGGLIKASVTGLRAAESIAAGADAALAAQ